MLQALSDNFVGTVVSQATLLTEDLIEAFADFLENNHPEAFSQIAGVLSTIRDFTGYDGHTALYVLNEDMFDIMNEIAPEGCIFGAHEGDGSLFGFWLCEGYDWSEWDDDDEEVEW